MSKCRFWASAVGVLCVTPLVQVYEASAETIWDSFAKEQTQNHKSTKPIDSKTQAKKEVNRKNKYLINSNKISSIITWERDINPNNQNTKNILWELAKDYEVISKEENINSRYREKIPYTLAEASASV